MGEKPHTLFAVLNGSYLIVKAGVISLYNGANQESRPSDEAVDVAVRS